MGKSMMEKIALLPEHERAALLQGLDMESLMWDWKVWARPEQMPPTGDDWSIWLYMAGRGAGKTRSAAEWVREKAKDTSQGQLRFALVARTAADVRDVIVEGESGIISVSPPSERPLYEPSKRRLTWPNGNTATCFCASDDTEVLTRDRGWVTHDRLSAGDVILTLNTATGLSEWQPARGVYRFAVEDIDMARIGGRFHDSLTTMNHRWPVWDRNGKTRWTTTEEITNGDAGTKSRIISAAPNADLPLTPVHSDALVEIVAWYMTEGTRRHDYETSSFTLADYDGWNAWLDIHAPRTKKAVRSGRRIRGPKTLSSFCTDRGLDYDEARTFFKAKPGRLSISISQSLTVNPSKCAAIRKALTECFGPPREIHAETGRTWAEFPPAKGRTVAGFHIDPDAANEITTHFIDAKNKVVSREFIMSLTKAQLELFVSVCLDGDGYRKTQRTFGMGQNSEQRSDIFALALTLLGVPYSQFADEKTYNGNPYMWFSTSARRSPGVPLLPRIVDDIEIHKYSGVVWCPQTDNSTWFARRNGKVYFTGNTADEPDGLRGPQFHYAWADEAAAWRQTPDAAGMTSWDNLRVACRLGRAPQIIATTTPKRVPLLRSLLAEADKTGRVIVSRGSTLDNAGNLSGTYLDAITGVYAGTRLAAQELFGEMLDDAEGALWNEDLIERSRERVFPVGAPLRVVGVDPSVAENPKDECGIVVCASTGERDLYRRNAWVLEDATVHGSPEQWANAVVAMARKYSCPVVAEVNQGGALVTNAIRTIDPNIKVLEVHSKHGKALRAEPITLAYEQNRVHHVNYLADLESQMISWVPGEGKSPDRVDALVHALTALLIKPPAGFVGGQITAKSMASRRLPAFRGGNSGGARVFKPR